jgi:uncharacterized protein
VTVDSKDFPASFDRSPERLLSSGIYVDQEGDWHYQDDKITREDILELFLTNLNLSAGGTFVIHWMGQHCTLKVADTPFIVSRVDRIQLDDEKRDEMVICLKHLPDPEVLDLSTLKIGEGNIPYCSVRNGQFRARFSRPAYYQLAAWIEQDPDTGAFYLELNGRQYPLETADQPTREDAAGQ